MTRRSDPFAAYQNVLDAIPYPIFVKNRAHRIVLLNRSACLFFGYTRKRMLAQTDYDLFPSDQVEEVHASDDVVFDTGADGESEVAITTSTGDVSHALTVKRIVNTDGSRYLLKVITDISQQIPFAYSR